MPTQTYFNLSKSKRDRVRTAALKEFADYPYHKASVTRIINRADIASGSFYQYFEDKKDLYQYIIDYCSEKKMDYMKDVLQEIDEINFFEFLRKLYKTGIDFAQKNPKIEAIGNHLIKNNNSEIFEELALEAKSKSIQLYKKMLTVGINRGDIDPELDVNLVAQLLIDFHLYTLSDLIYEDGHVDYDDLELVDKIINIFKNGIKNREQV